MIDDTHTYIAGGFRVHNAIGDDDEMDNASSDIKRYNWGNTPRYLRMKRPPNQPRRGGGRISNSSRTRRSTRRRKK